MPIYEYRCQDCGKKFEKLVRSQPDAPKECPSCGKEQLTQEFSTFSAHAHGAAPKSPEAPPCAGGGGRCPGSCGMNFN